MKQKTLMIVPIIVLIAISIISCAQPCPEVGKSAPEFTLQNTDTKSVSLSDFRGKTVIMNFWATWCGPCQFEIPFFQATHNERASKGVVMLGIDLKESAATVKNFATNKGMTYPILLDTEAQVAQEYCLPSVIPITLFVNSEGIIEARKIGAFSNQAELESMLNSVK